MGVKTQNSDQPKTQTSAQRSAHPDQRFVRHHQTTLRRPAVQQFRQRAQFGHIRHKRAAALLGRLDRMGLQAILSNTLGIGERGLHRTNPGGPHLGRLLDDEICEGLFDRREQQPQIGRVLLRGGLRRAGQRTAALASLVDIVALASLLAKVPCLRDRVDISGQAFARVARWRKAFARGPPDIQTCKIGDLKRTHGKAKGGQRHVDLVG